MRIEKQHFIIISMPVAGGFVRHTSNFVDPDLGVFFRFQNCDYFHNRVVVYAGAIVGWNFWVRGIALPRFGNYKCLTPSFHVVLYINNPSRRDRCSIDSK